jgi:hypothetical protein
MQTIREVAFAGLPQAEPQKAQTMPKRHDWNFQSVPASIALYDCCSPADLK